MHELVLSLEALDGATGWSGRWSLDGNQVGQSISVDGAQAEAVRAVSRDFLELFERKDPQGRSLRPIVESPSLAATGTFLHEQWFKPVRDRLQAGLKTHGASLLISSRDPFILNLPWELVELSPGLPVGCDPGCRLRRTCRDRLDGPADLAPGPLRIQFLAAAPTDQQQLDFEKEEEAILRATGRIQNTVMLPIADSGGLEELTDLVAEHHPHVVHLSGHGVLRPDGQAVFAFEDERGRTDSRCAREVAERIFRGNRSVRCVFLNGCQTSQAAVAGFCQALVTAGVPLVVGWAGSVADNLATDFAEEFYRRLVRGESVSTAAAHARQAVRRKGDIERGKLQDATFAAPQVYACTASDEVFDPTAPPQEYKGPRTRHVLLGDGIKGLKEGYVGRRREGQKLIPRMRAGEVTLALITGIGGMGKSTLATRTANRLEADGYRVLPVRVEEGDDPAAQGSQAVTKIVDALDRAFLGDKRDDLHAHLTNPNLAIGQRLRLAVDALNQLRYLLVLDNFESALDLQTRGIIDPELASFCTYLADNLTTGSAAIVTCRYLPAGIPADRPTVFHLPLPDFQEHDFIKFLRREPKVEARMLSGELKSDLLATLHKAFGGTPRFLQDVRTILKTIDPDELRDELEGIAPGLLEAHRQAYYEQIITARVYGVLSEPARQVTSCLAVSELPLPLDAVSRIAELSADRVKQALDEAVSYGLVHRFEQEDLPDLFHPPGVLRAWLIQPERISPDRVRQVHQTLAAFWCESYEAERERELRVPIDVELLVCRLHASLGGADGTFAWATVRLARRLTDRSEWKSARRLLEEIPESRRDGPSWHALATLDVNEGDYPAAREKLGKCLPIMQAAGDRAGEAATWAQLAYVDLSEGNYAEARSKYEKAKEVLAAIGDRAGEAATWHQLASIDLNEGNYPAAREKFNRSLSIYQARGDRAGEAATWAQLAYIDLSEGNYAEARSKYEKAKDVLAEIGDRAGEAKTWHQLASIDLNEGNYRAAREKLNKSLSIKQAIGDRAGAAKTWHQLASIDLEEGNYPAAREKFNSSLSIKQAIGNRVGEANTWYQLGYLAYKAGCGEAGARLVAICCLIEQDIGHGDAYKNLRQLMALCSQLGYDQEQFDQVFKDAAEGYKADRGQELLRKAFEGTENSES